MTARTGAAIGGGIVLLALIMWLLSSGPDEAPSGAAEGIASAGAVIDLDASDLAAVAIYFPDENGLLSAEERHIPTWTTPEAGALRVLETLIAGPESDVLHAPLPTAVSLGPVYLSAASVLYVDLVSTTLSAPPPTGSQMELMSVYSLVNTLTLAIPEIESVVLLWNGRQPVSFGGHVDTSLPLTTDRDLIGTGR